MRKTLILILIILCQSVYSQDSIDTSSRILKYGGVNLERYVSVLTGFNFWSNEYVEIGVALNQYGSVGRHPAAWSIFASSEVKWDSKLLIGPKIGAWVGGGVGGMALGINMIYYTNFENSSLRIRPEIGMGFGRWKVVYGYNIPITNHLTGINRSNIGLAFLIGLKKVKTIRK